MTEASARGMAWDPFRRWFQEQWKPGQHISVIGPTGTGKSNLVVNLLTLRRHALALDVKGGDTTLGKLERYGFVRTGWPLDKREYRRMGEGAPGRFIVGKRARTAEEMRPLRDMIGRCIHDVFAEGHWSVYVDELQMAASPKMWNLGSGIELNLIAARDRGVSIITSCQAPRWVPRAASDQANWVFLFPTRDRDVVARLSEIAGRPRQEIQGAIRGLGPQSDHMVLVVGTDAYAPLIITRAPLA